MRALQIIFLLIAWFWVLTWVGSGLRRWMNERWVRALEEAQDRSEQARYERVRGVTRP